MKKDQNCIITPLMGNIEYTVYCTRSYERALDVTDDFSFFK